MLPALVVLLALGIRLGHAWAAIVISPDSAIFIDYARELGEKPLEAVRSYHQHPGYPALILLTHALLRPLLDDSAAGWIVAGRTAAIAGSLLAVLAVYWLAAPLHGRRRALVAAALLAILPDACRVGADVLSDLPHLAAYLAGLAALLRGLRTGRSRWFLAGGACSGLAFLIRPEGGAVLVIAVASVLLFVRGWPLKRRLGVAAGVVAVFVLLAGPYQLATGKLIPKKSLLKMLDLAATATQYGYPQAVGIRGLRPPCGPPWKGGQLAARPARGTDGQVAARVPLNSPPFQGGARGRVEVENEEWRMPNGELVAPYSQRGYPQAACIRGLRPPCGPPWKGGRSAAPVGLAGSAPAPVDLAASVPAPVDVLYQWGRATRVIYLLLAILGLAVARLPRDGRWLLGAAVGLHVLLLMALKHSYGYLDRRHAMILAVLCLVPAAAGLWWTAGRICRQLRKTVPECRKPALAGLLVVCALATSPWLLRPINAGEQHVAAAIAWVREHTPSDAVIVTDDRLHRLALCADRRFERWPWWGGDVAALRKHLTGRGPCYFVVEARHMTLPQRNPRFFEQLQQTFGQRLELLHAVPSPPGVPRTEIRIYRWAG